jgi:putative flippase GtrA
MVDVVAETRRPRRYLAVGVVCAAFHNLTMFVTDAAGIHYMPALVLSFLLILPTAYALHSRYTFERDIAPVRFVRFAGGVLAGFPINFVLMVVLVSGLRLSVPVATLIATFVLFMWNYVAVRWAILLHLDRGKQPG